ncbi:MAG: HAD family phosphatase [Verrucomicrobium sp.]|nr:HAD family phosphatase [Verrucomicrobium sp.]
MKLDIPSGPFDGALFDCDGTLADTMPFHYQAWLHAFKQFQTPFEFDEDYFYSLGGTSTVHVPEIFNQKYGTNFDALEIAHAKEEIFLKLVNEATSIPPIGEVVAVAQEYKKAGKPVGVVSGGMRSVVDHIVDAIGLGGGFFPVVVTPEDVPAGRGKPQPDMFLLAAQRLGLDPKKTVVFEDAPPGIAAGKAAGMAVVFVPRP